MISPWVSPLGRQRDHLIVHPGQPALSLLDNRRLERGIPIPRHLHLDRPDLGQQCLGPRAVARVAAVTTSRIMLAVAEMIIHLALQRRLEHPLGQPGEQPTLPGHLQALGPSPLGQLPDHPLIHHLAGHRLSRRSLGTTLAASSMHTPLWTVTPLRLQSRRRGAAEQGARVPRWRRVATSGLKRRPPGWSEPGRWPESRVHGVAAREHRAHVRRGR